MDDIDFILAILFIAFLVISYFLKKGTLFKIRKGNDVFLSWHYSPDDWSKVVAEFPKLKSPAKWKLQARWKSPNNTG